MLMEDDTADSILHSDHPALLKVHRPFAQILFSHSFRTNNDDKGTYASVPLHVTDSSNNGLANGLLLCNGDHRKQNSDISGAGAVGAFFKSMEEASRLLPEYGTEEPSRLFPKCNDFRRDDLADKIFSESTYKVLKRRYNRVKHLEDDEVVVARKTAKVMKGMDEISEMFDDLMLHSYEACAREMKKLCIAVDNDKIHNRSNKATMYCVD